MAVEVIVAGAHLAGRFHLLGILGVDRPGCGFSLTTGSRSAAPRSGSFGGEGIVQFGVAPHRRRRSSTLRRGDHGGFAARGGELDGGGSPSRAGCPIPGAPVRRRRRCRRDRGSGIRCRSGSHRGHRGCHCRISGMFSSLSWGPPLVPGGGLGDLRGHQHHVLGVGGVGGVFIEVAGIPPPAVDILRLGIDDLLAHAVQASARLGPLVDLGFGGRVRPEEGLAVVPGPAVLLELLAVGPAEPECLPCRPARPRGGDARRCWNW